MITVVAAVIERSDRRFLIGQRRKNDTSPLKWEFPGGKVRGEESPEAALARELQEELGVTLVKSVELGRVRHHYAGTPERSEEHTSELQSRSDLVCRLLLEKKNNKAAAHHEYQKQKVTSMKEP